MRWLAVLVVAGCTTAPAGPCEDASEHVSTCTGEALAYRPESVCDAGRSNALLAMDCTELSQLATEARNAGWWDDFLCQIDFADRCATSSQRRSLVGLVERADGSPAPRVFVRLVSPGNAYSPIAGAWTIAGGAFAVMDLAPQAYRLEIAMSPTGAALSAHDISADQPFVAVAAPIP